MSSRTSTSTWALASLALGLAAYLGLQPSSSDSAAKTYCYEGVETFSDAQPSARCFTVARGRFSRVFTPDLSADFETLPGYVIPGLWDGHGHLLQYGEFLHSVDLFGSSSAEEVRRRVIEYIEAHPGAGQRGEW